MNDYNLKPLSSGHLTEEEERAIRSKGGIECAKKKRRAKTAQELLALALSSEITDKALQKQIDALGLDGNTVDLALIASTLKNTMRKGMIGDALEAFTVAGRSADEADEEAHRAFLRALTEDDDAGTT